MLRAGLGSQQAWSGGVTLSCGRPSIMSRRRPVAIPRSCCPMMEGREGPELHLPIRARTSLATEPATSSAAERMKKWSPGNIRMLQSREVSFAQA
jgi:hypothetical protein